MEPVEVGLLGQMAHCLNEPQPVSPGSGAVTLPTVGSPCILQSDHQSQLHGALYIIYHPGTEPN